MFVSEAWQSPPPKKQVVTHPKVENTSRCVEGDWQVKAQRKSTRELFPFGDRTLWARKPKTTDEQDVLPKVEATYVYRGIVDQKPTASQDLVFTVAVPKWVRSYVNTPASVTVSLVVEHPGWIESDDPFTGVKYTVSVDQLLTSAIVYYTSNFAPVRNPYVRMVMMSIAGFLRSTPLPVLTVRVTTAAETQNTTQPLALAVDGTVRVETHQMLEIDEVTLDPDVDFVLL